MTKIVCISDTHSMHNQITLPEGDIIVHAGDCTNRGSEREIMEFLDWYSGLSFTHKILVAGNHDWGFDTNSDKYKKVCSDMGIIYLEDSDITLEGIKFYGSPHQPEFCDWAFNKKVHEGSTGVGCYRNNELIKPYWDKIPEDTNVLITHGPPHGIMDVAVSTGQNCGCPHLLKRVEEINPQYHIFGHIHNWQGKRVGTTTFVNASICTEQYDPTNIPIVIEL